VDVRRLHPEPGDLTIADVLGELDLAAAAPPDRPYVICNMVASADGKAAVAGRTKALGSEADRELFHRLRTRADAVMVGTGTLRIERYGRLVRDPALVEARERAGLAPLPIAVVITRSLEVPLDIPLFQDPDSTVALYTSAEAELEPTPATVRVTRLDPGEMTMTAALRRLREDHGVRSVLCEGGPTVLAALIGERVLDELFLTLAPKLAGGEPLTIVAGAPLPEPAELDLLWLLEREGELYARYAVRR
jgi:riboflavin-specific deaminase-like protein